MQQDLESVIIDTGDNSVKKCKFCDSMLSINNYEYLYSNLYDNNIPDEAFDRCTCEDANIYWKNYDYIKRIEKDRKDMILKIDKVFNNHNIGKRYENSSFDNFVVTKENENSIQILSNYIEAYLQNKTRQGLFISGKCGIGKTHLATAIANALIQNNIPMIFGTLSSLLDKIKETYKSDNYTEMEYIQMYSEVDMLIIDDLGKEKISEWVLEKLFVIINNRYNNYLPVIITTNYDKEELSRRLNVNQNDSMVESIISRLYEMCGGIEIKGEDYRLSDLTNQESNTKRKVSKSTKTNANL